MHGAQRVETLIASAISSFVAPSSAVPPWAARAISLNDFIESGAAWRRVRVATFMLPISAFQSSTMALFL
jgi:hypothetical protein